MCACVSVCACLQRRQACDATHTHSCACTHANTHAPDVSCDFSYRSRTKRALLMVSGTQSSQGKEPWPEVRCAVQRRCAERERRVRAGARACCQAQRRQPGAWPCCAHACAPACPQRTPGLARRCWRATGDTPVLLLRGGSPGAANAQPVWLSCGSSGRVRCQVGCTTLTPTASCRPCRRVRARAAARARVCVGRSLRQHVFAHMCGRDTAVSPVHARARRACARDTLHTVARHTSATCPRCTTRTPCTKQQHAP
jgi:hypothetical protein